MSSNSTTTTMNHRQHETQAPQAVAMLILCPAIAALFVVMRIYTRVILTRKYFLEDYSIVAALTYSLREHVWYAQTCAVATSVFMGIAVLNGAGRHIEFVTAAELTRLRQASIGTIQFYILAHFFLKTSILLQYVRVSVMPFEERLCHTLLGVNGCGYLALTIVNLARCTPFEANWTPNLPGSHCANSTLFFFSSQFMNMAMDIVILIAPLFILRHMTIPWLQRLTLGIVLAFGGIACIVSAIRLKTLYPSTTSADPTWDKTPSGFYGQIEVNLGIACASFVTLRPLFARWRQLLSASMSKHVQSGTQEQRPQPRVINDDKDLTIVSSTQVTSNSSGMELDEIDKDHSQAGSSITCSGRVEGAVP